MRKNVNIQAGQGKQDEMQLFSFFVFITWEVTRWPVTLMSLCLEMEMSEINGKVALSNNFPFMVIIMILFYSSFKFFKNNKKNSTSRISWLKSQSLLLSDGINYCNSFSSFRGRRFYLWIGQNPPHPPQSTLYPQHFHSLLAVWSCILYFIPSEGPYCLRLRT